MLHNMLRKSRSSIVSLGLAVSLASALLLGVIAPAGAQPAAPVGVSSCPILDLANPGPGSQLSAGDLIVSGISLDPVTQSPTGVSRVDFFLGSRDSGGEIIGSVVPSASPMADHPNAFQTTLTLPDVNRSDTLTAYAYSATSPATTILSFPVQIGSETKTTSGATATPVPASTTVKMDCPTVGLSGNGTGLSVAPATAPVVAVTPGQGPTLQLGNPNTDDVLPRGTYIASGVAFDPASTQGAGVDQVDFFLGARDAGGIHLGTATPGLAGGRLGAFVARLWIPVNASGGHDFVAYAHSTITGLESSVSIPVFVGTRPTTTP